MPAVVVVVDTHLTPFAKKLITLPVLFKHIFPFPIVKILNMERLLPPPMSVTEAVVPLTLKIPVLTEDISLESKIY